MTNQKIPTKINKIWDLVLQKVYFGFKDAEKMWKNSQESCRVKGLFYKVDKIRNYRFLVKRNQKLKCQKIFP